MDAIGLPSGFSGIRSLQLFQNIVISSKCKKPPSQAVYNIIIPVFVLTQELASALVDRDRAICEKSELLEKYCHEVKDKAEAQKELSQACKDIETVREERDVARKERTEAIIQRDQLLREYYQARQVSRQTGDLS